MTTPADLCRYAADKFRSGEWKWAQADRIDGTIPFGCHCAETAIYEAIYDLRQEDLELYQPALECVRRSLGLSHNGAIWHWNDAPGRTKEHVIEALERAAA